MVHRESVGVYPGTFDPITKGHLDIIDRAARHLVDRLVVGVAQNAGKRPMFSTEERVQMIREEIAHMPDGMRERVVVKPFDDLLIHFVHQQGAALIVRGLRAVSDFEYEFQMASMNSRLDPEVETVFLTAGDRNHFVASRLVKEVGRLGGDVSSFVSPRVEKALRERFGHEDDSMKIQTLKPAS